MFIHHSIDVKIEDLYVKYFRVLVFAREQDVARRGLRCWRRLWPAQTRLRLSKTWHIFYHKTWITVTGRGGWPGRAWLGGGADNAKFTHQHNTGPISSTSILSPLKHSLLLTDMIMVTKISDLSFDNLKYDPRRCS